MRMDQAMPQRSRQHKSTCDSNSIRQGESKGVSEKALVRERERVREAINCQSEMERSGGGRQRGMGGGEQGGPIID
jgi:hypothetical protein